MEFAAIAPEAHWLDKSGIARRTEQLPEVLFDTRQAIPFASKLTEAVAR